MSELRDRVTLAIDGQRFDGWTGVSIRSALDELTASFDLGHTTRWPGQLVRSEIRTGVACSVAIGGDTLITGWVDEAEGSIDVSQSSFRVSGRDRTGDLVDCSAVHPRGSWVAASLATIVRELVEPFGVTATIDDPSSAPIPRFALEQGETVHAAIERLARFRGLLLTSTPEGNLRLGRLERGGHAGSLELGRNLLSVRAKFGAAERFSEVIVKGQAAGNDRASGKAVSQASGRARDPAVRRHRPLVVVAEDQADRGSAEARARWEVSVRAAREQEVEGVVQGWRTDSGALWQRGMLAQVRAVDVGVEQELMVKSVEFGLGEEGTTTRVSLVHPDALRPEPISDKARLDALVGDRGGRN